MEAHRRTWFDERGLIVHARQAEPGSLHSGGERVIPFYAGTLDYWRVPPAKWATYLRGLHASGFTLVETSIPWRIHEPEAGEALWSGDYDLAKFLDAVRAAGLSAVLRVGPAVDATVTSFGLPDWVLAEPECQAKTVHGSPAWMPLPPRAFPIPSYASKQFHAHVRKWFAAIAHVVKPFLVDTVVAIGIDNEAQHFFRNGAFDLDYHSDALEWWREHSGLEAPPREWSEANAAPCALWLKHQDEYTARALGEFSQALDAVGFAGIARFHNVAPIGYSDVRAIESRIDGPVALDSYSAKTDLGALRRRASIGPSHTSSGPAFARLLGLNPWLPPVERSERDELLSLLAAGCRGFVVDHDASWQKTLIAALVDIDWPALRREKLIALVDVRADARFGIATNLIDPVTPALAEALNLGPGGAAELGTDEAAIAARKWHTAIARALELAQIAYAIVDEATPEDELARYRAVIAPTPGPRIDRGLFSRLRGLAEHKKSIVVIGPSTPTRNELDQPLGEPMPKRVGKLKEGSLEDLAGLAEDLAGLAGDIDDAWLVERPDSVRTYAYSNRVVFVVSDADRATTAVINASEGVTSLRDPFGERLRVDGGRVTVPMQPRSVRMLIVD